MNAKNAIGHLGKYHNTLCLSPQITHKHCFQFLLGITMVSREHKNNAYAKFEATNEGYYGIFRNGLLRIYKPNKFRTSTRFGPVTWRYWCDALTNWAMKPLTFEGSLMSPWGMNVKLYMKYFIYRTADVKSSKLWSSHLEATNDQLPTSVAS